MKTSLFWAERELPYKEPFISLEDAHLYVRLDKIIEWLDKKNSRLAREFLVEVGKNGTP